MREKDEILVSFEDGIKTITINLPHKRNALSSANALRMAEQLETSEEDGTRVVILSGAGGAFCAGADLSQTGHEKILRGGAQTEKELDANIRTTYHRLSNAVYNLPRPVIAAVDGVAAGFGLSLALNADITLGSDRIRFIEIFINIALIPDGGSTYILPKIVGLKKAMEMIFTGDSVYAEEALRLNMVNRIYPADELMDRARAWARKLAAGPVRSMGVAKKTVYDAYQMSAGEALDMESLRQAHLLTQPDFANAVASFFEKKKPTYS